MAEHWGGGVGWRGRRAGGNGGRAWDSTWSAPTTSLRVGRARGPAARGTWGQTGGPGEGGCAAFYPSRSWPSSLWCSGCLESERDRERQRAVEGVGWAVVSLGY